MFISPRSAVAALRVVAAIALYLLATAARGELVADVDVARIAVADRSSSARASARRAGMEQVLVKLSGSRGSLDNAAVREALGNSARYLLRYSYEEDAEGGVLLRLEYDGRALSDVLRAAGEPLWTRNRPTVLGWLVLSDGEQRSFATRDATPEVHRALSEAFSRRGVPLQQPLYDIEDMRQLSPGIAWRGGSAALASASARYPAKELLAGRAARLSDGSWLGEWRFLDRGRWIRRQVSVSDMHAFVAAGANLAADSLAARYAVIGDEGGDLRYGIRVEGIASYADFRRMRDALRGLEAVDRLVPERISAEEVLLRLDSAASPEQLARIIELDARFAPLAANGVQELNYRWEGAQ
jgi:hypothetical protein